MNHLNWYDLNSYTQELLGTRGVFWTTDYCWFIFRFLYAFDIQNQMSSNVVKVV